jgi:hypothetical protein
MAKPSMNGGGVELPEVANPSPSVGKGPSHADSRTDLSAPRDLGEQHRVEKVIHMLHELHGLIDGRALATRVDAPRQYSVTISNPPPIETAPQNHPSSLPSPASRVEQPQTVPVNRDYVPPSISEAPKPTLAPTPPRPVEVRELQTSPSASTPAPSAISTKVEQVVQHDSPLSQPVEKHNEAIPQDPVQALEKALDSILKGYSTSSMPTAETAPAPAPAATQSNQTSQPIPSAPKQTTETALQPAANQQQPLSQPPVTERTATTPLQPSLLSQPQPQLQSNPSPEISLSRPLEQIRTIPADPTTPPQYEARIRQQPIEFAPPVSIEKGSVPHATQNSPSEQPKLSATHDGERTPSETQVTHTTLSTSVERVEPKSIPQSEIRPEQQPREVQQRQNDQAEQQRLSRVEQIQVTQQILATCTEQLVAIQIRTQIEQTPLTVQPRHESTTVAIEHIRESVLDKLTAIASQLEMIHAAHSRPNHPEGLETKLNIQGRHDLCSKEPVRHDIKQTLDVRHGDRAAPVPSLTQLVRDFIPFVAGVAAPATTAAARGQTPTSIIGSHSSLDKLNSLFDLLKRFTQRTSNTQMLVALDSPLEKACLSLVTGAALGVVGVEMMIRTANLALAELLRALRQEKKNSSLPEEDLSAHQAITAELEAYIHHTFIEPIKSGLVADVTGTLLDSATQQPLHGVLIGSTELGSTITNQEGRFLFKNVPLESSYSLTFYKPGFQLTPNTLRGLCTLASHHDVVLQVSALKP